MTGTVDYAYNRDLNAPVYLNANLPAPDSVATGVDARPRWIALTTATQGTCPATGNPITAANPTGSCFQRINNAVGNQVTAAYVIKNQSQNRSWNIATSVTKPMSHGVSLSGGYGYGDSRSLVEPSSTAGSSWGSANPIVFDPNNPALARSANAQGNRVFLSATYTRQYFSWGGTTVSMFYSASPSINNFSTGNSYIFLPTPTATLNERPDLHPEGPVGDELQDPHRQRQDVYTCRPDGRVRQYIQNDDYLRTTGVSTRSETRFFSPLVNRIDLSLMQDVFHKVGGARHSGQIRLDITNFGNLLNHNWGVFSASCQRPDPDEPRYSMRRGGCRIRCSRRTAI